MKKTFSRRSGLAVAVAIFGTVGLAGCGGGSSQTNFGLTGTVSGLSSGTLQLTNGYSVVTMAGDGTFIFPLRLQTGNAYSVSVYQQPADLTCRVANGTGTTASADITDVQVTCVANHALSGTVTGLKTGQLVLVNGTEAVTVSAKTPASGATPPDVSFAFNTKVGNGFAYGVTILQPAPQPCTVQQGSGIATADVTNILVVCQ